ncbi:MAG: bifunctional phosphoribosyl-AMP cyclohydrolase/phosphoribosyl-ATP diphosphatase HisIE [Bacteroidota bacterium]|jgi:phosphoribosyl-ATP pyrophosphohydrolase/phosphoribosyl-AMP cyclohydrolase|nr:bifunctional phosphoribosyl-AMP cyclohydrolase/phosphoribosyl-ATP diphosphatase HisIE [Ignavibacteria bacterium]MCU7498265.1 bifunctional phosphoribosyl-AMP cyclohydrolase/phosphoribosyl-ATP diphosphatase HisIE [Ignavibacteria bacterium]MCU7519035.1 bifunctional phosphoribosyl-AMP cyclohydrolase/phosphoribosyl-ATP diphosphatase HisIE [Ignavibacteria bacterium]MCU7523316.1 bifunctional phosphoribosyl-AMP cyclohydrolase/phosphoribosyl-ATP diphosphatase HisIE [Ignavibacteria bacterium]
MIDISKLDFNKMGGLIPAVVTDNSNGEVLMLGFMNKEALDKTMESGLVTFFSRSKGRLWTKGETSGNYLKLVSVAQDCDNDSLLIKANPEGNTCHTGGYSCFFPEKPGSINFLNELFSLIKDRKEKLPEGSYTTKLFQRGANRIIQKVGEEAIETVIAAKNRDKNELINETSDLIYHMFVMLAEQEIEFTDIVKNLEMRHSK